MLDFTPPDPELCFDAFYVNVMRLGRFPARPQTYKEALQGTDPVVLINPGGELGSAESYKRFIEQGGKAALLKTLKN